MTAYDFAAAAGRAVSLFNLCALLWLGLTVLLNAERRSLGAWLAGGGLLLGSLMFAAHTALLTRQPYLLGPEMDWWWRAAWLPFVLPPYLWFVIMAWYTGRLKSRRSHVALSLMSAWGLAALLLLAAAAVLPSFRVFPQPLGAYPAQDSPAVLLLLYPGFSLTCIVVALAALARPAPSERFMGDLGRRRAVPWLMGASAALLAVGIGAGGVAAWFLADVQGASRALLTAPGTAALLALDAVIATLVAVAVVLLGRAIVSYEIFTGKVLPRGGLLRQWWASLVLAAVIGIAGGAGLNIPFQPVHLIMLAASVVVTLSALLSWQSYRERDRSIERLRPFVAGPRPAHQLLAPTGPRDDAAARQFRALCDDVLETELAYLMPAASPLLPTLPPLAHPDRATPPALSSAWLTQSFPSPQPVCVPVEPATHGGTSWAVSLWSERGLSGVLLLGDKRDGSLYTQEEIEIARAAAERLLDTQASTMMARRLIELQRQRLAEGRVLDRRARHVLHDEILPRLHTAMLSLYGAPASPARNETAALLAGVHQQIAALLRSLPGAPDPDAARLGLVAALRQEMDAGLASEFDRVQWHIGPRAEEYAQALPPLIAEVVFGAAREAIRNAARHGRGNDPGGPLNLTIRVEQKSGVQVVIEDDGVGPVAIVGETATANLNGSGQGLELHTTMMATVGGALGIEARAGGGTRVTITLPASFG